MSKKAMTRGADNTTNAAGSTRFGSADEGVGIQFTSSPSVVPSCADSDAFACGYAVEMLQKGQDCGYRSAISFASTIFGGLLLSPSFSSFFFFYVPNLQRRRCSCPIPSSSQQAANGIHSLRNSSLVHSQQDTTFQSCSPAKHEQTSQQPTPPIGHATKRAQQGNLTATITTHTHTGRQLVRGKDRRGGRAKETHFLTHTPVKRSHSSFPKTAIPKQTRIHPPVFPTSSRTGRSAGQALLPSQPNEPDRLVNTL